jgi:hypothetical protein
MNKVRKTAIVRKAESFIGKKFNIKSRQQKTIEKLSEQYKKSRETAIVKDDAIERTPEGRVDIRLARLEYEKETANRLLDGIFAQRIKEIEDRMAKPHSRSVFSRLMGRSKTSPDELTEYMYRTGAIRSEVLAAIDSRYHNELPDEDTGEKDSMKEYALAISAVRAVIN